MKLSRDDQLAVLLRARALLAHPDGWKNEGRYHDRGPNARRRYNVAKLTLGEACQQAAFELDLVSTKKSATYTVALATGLLNVIDHWNHKSLAGFNNDPGTHKKDVLGLLDRRILELL